LEDIEDESLTVMDGEKRNVSLVSQSGCFLLISSHLLLFSSVKTAQEVTGPIWTNGDQSEMGWVAARDTKIMVSGRKGIPHFLSFMSLGSLTPPRGAMLVELLMDQLPETAHSSSLKACGIPESRRRKERAMHHQAHGGSKVTC
jgi:hypothetical protein